MTDAGSPPATTGEGLLAWRLGAVEEQYKQLDGKVDNVQTGLSDLRKDMSDQFASLRKDLFEEPHFLTIQQSLIADAAREKRIADIEDAIKTIHNDIKTINAGGISTARHYTTVGIAIAGVFLAPFIADYLGRIGS